MRTLIFGLVILLNCHWTESPNQSDQYEKLQLISVHQLITTDTLNFDFSGITLYNDSIFIIADKPWNTQLYTITFDEKGWYANYAKAISSTERLDLEAVDHCNGNFYLANEYTGSINALDSETNEAKILPINFESKQLVPNTWKNAGWEGLATDCENEIMYLVKERQPRSIITVDMKSWVIIDQFDIPQTESNDFADAKFQNGHLYLLERNGNYVTKVNTKTKQVVQKYHYKHVASHPNGKLYAPEKYGMAEALLLLDDEIWIGLDNNGLYVTAHAKAAYQMSGKAPAMLKFKRPNGF